jgi:uncharacterized protein (UPF0332 family)
VSEEIQRHFERGAECIEDAQVLLQNNRLAAVVTRAYYAMFHAATAVLLARGIERSSHHGLLSAFAEQFVKTRQLDRRFFLYLREAFERRQQSDYDPVVDVDRQTVEEILDHAVEFVAACKNIVN